MIRSSFVEWLILQVSRPDNIGDLSRWVYQEMENGFSPVDMQCVLDRIDEKEAAQELQTSTYDALLEFYDHLLANNVTADNVKVLSDEDVMKEKLDNAVRDEDYEKAAKLRDEMNQKKE